MNGVKLAPMLRDVLQGISLDELERIPGLGPVVHAHDFIEASAVVSHRSTSSPAE